AQTNDHTPSRQNAKITLASLNKFSPLACNKFMSTQDNEENDRRQSTQLLDKKRDMKNDRRRNKGHVYSRPLQFNSQPIEKRPLTPHPVQHPTYYNRRTWENNTRHFRALTQPPIISSHNAYTHKNTLSPLLNPSYSDTNKNGFSPNYINPNFHHYHNIIDGNQNFFGIQDIVAPLARQLVDVISNHMVYATSLIPHNLSQLKFLPYPPG
ncbi:hypothetical protein MN116_000575, partial [Schistosoma mekongi]